MKSRNKIVEENLGLVHSCCKRFKGKGIEYEDLYMAGCVGLIKAVDKFDDTLGYKLSTYAVPVILGEIKRLFREGGTVKVSRNLKELYLKINTLTEKENNLTISEIAEKLDTTEENTEIDLTVNSCEEECTEKISLKKALEDLCDEDNKLIELRYFKHMTQKETGKTLNMTQVQVSRKEKRILHNIRSKMLC